MLYWKMVTVIGETWNLNKIFDFFDKSKNKTKIFQPSKVWREQ